MVESAEAAEKAFDAKVKESDDFLNKMKKEIEQAEKRAKEKKALEKQVVSHKKTIEENEAAISKLQSDLQKLSELRSKEKEDHEVELAATRESVKMLKNTVPGDLLRLANCYPVRSLSCCVFPTCFCPAS